MRANVDCAMALLPGLDSKPFRCGARSFTRASRASLIFAWSSVFGSTPLAANQMLMTSQGSSRIEVFPEASFWPRRGSRPRR